MTIQNNKNCYSCYFCYSCDSCYSCYFCYSCYSCDFCYSCDSCDSCDFCYSCDSSKNLRMSERMIFCLGEGRYESKGEGYQKNNRIFNVQLTPEEFDKVKSELPVIKIPLTKWVDKKDMTDKEKENSSVWEEIGGYLKVNTYEEAWAIWWQEAKQEDKDKILNCGYFNKDIFEKITGLKIDKKETGKKIKIKTANGQIVELEGEIIEA